MLSLTEQRKFTTQALTIGISTLQLKVVMRGQSQLLIMVNTILKESLLDVILEQIMLKRLLVLSAMVTRNQMLTYNGLSPNTSLQLQHTLSLSPRVSRTVLSKLT